MTITAETTNETERLRSLSAYRVLGMRRASAFDALTTITAQILDVPMARISLVDTDHAWPLSCVGCEPRKVQRSLSPCGHVVASGDALFLSDATADARFAESPLFTGKEHIRAYAGAPLTTPGGFVVGTLCAFDRRRREFTATQREMLALLARQVVDQLELRRLDALLRTSRGELEAAELRGVDAVSAAIDAERETGEVRLEESEARARAIVENAVDSIITIDGLGCIDRANPAVERMFGHVADDIIGQDVSTLIAASGDEERDALLALIRGGDSARSGAEFIATARRKDGSEFPASFVLSELVVSGRRLLSCVVRDISSRRAASARIRSLANVAEQTADGVLMTDLAGRIQYVNSSFEVMTGWSRAEAIGKTPRILKSGEKDRAYYEQLWATLLRGDVHRGSIVNVRKDGTIWYSTQTITPIRDDSGTVTAFVSVMRDETERRLAERQQAELDLATSIQQRLHPKRAAGVAGLEIGGFVLPASETSGDYYDWIKIEDDCAGIVVADVVGHGFGPALIMTATRSYLRPLLLMGLPPFEVVQQLDAVLNEDLDDGQFVTMLLVCLDLSTMRLTYANAGHVSGLVLDSGGALRATLESGGPPLGAWSDSTYAEPESIAVRAGDLVVLLTDGITECASSSGELLGDGPILDVLRAHAAAPVNEILRRIRELLWAFTGGVPTLDDATIVVCRVLSESTESE